MTSILKVDSLLKADGSSHGFSTSNILETLTLVGNGEPITVGSGTYTPANVTAEVHLTDSHAVINGSSIAYTPPTGATSVIYEFQYKIAWDSTAARICHSAMRIDGTQITGSRQTTGASGSYDQIHHYFKWRIPIGGSASTATGRVASWTSAKTIDMTVRRYDGNYTGRLFRSHYWDGGASNLPIDLPVLTITALK
jgi:hypothetical protein